MSITYDYLAGKQALAIPEGNVIKITKGSTILWQKPEPQPEQQDYIVVFPETTMTGAYNERFDITDYNITLNRKPSVGEKYVIVLNGVELSHTATDDWGQVQLYPDNPFFNTTGADTAECYLTFQGNVPSITLEVRYIPE